MKTKIKKLTWLSIMILVTTSLINVNNANAAKLTPPTLKKIYDDDSDTWLLKFCDENNLVYLYKGYWNNLTIAMQVIPNDPQCKPHTIIKQQLP